MSEILKSEIIDPERIPRHVAIIMDGNGRWAQKKGAMRIFGHQSAVQAVRDTTEGAAEMGIRYLTLYAFSTENWSRPKTEVSALMKLLVSTIRSEVKTLKQNNIRLISIGSLNALPKECQQELVEAREMTSSNTGLTVVLALNYSGRREILDAAKKFALATKNKEIDPTQATEYDFLQFMETSSINIPDPELLIRTSGEMRISNFLLWQLAYSELYFTEVLWPDFRKQHLHAAILDFQKRERRFGKTSEQLDKK